MPNGHTIADGLRPIQNVLLTHAGGGLSPQAPGPTYESYTPRAPPNMFAKGTQQSDNKNEGKKKEAQDSTKKDKKDKNTTAGAKKGK